MGMFWQGPGGSWQTVRKESRPEKDHVFKDAWGERQLTLSHESQNLVALGLWHKKVWKRTEAIMHTCSKET